MKTIKIFSAVVLCLALSMNMKAQETQSVTLKVPGVCGMCKKNIETAAKDAGATYALWNKESKILAVSFNSSSTNTARIEKKIAEAGYDTRDVKATDEAYNKLDDCCKYERAEVRLTPVAKGLKAEVLKTSIRNEKGTPSCGSAKTCCVGDEKACCKGEEKTTTATVKETPKPVQQ